MCREQWNRASQPYPLVLVIQTTIAATLAIATQWIRWTYPWGVQTEMSPMPAMTTAAPKVEALREVAAVAKKEAHHPRYIHGWNECISAKVSNHTKIPLSLKTAVIKFHQTELNALSIFSGSLYPLARLVFVYLHMVIIFSEHNISQSNAANISNLHSFNRRSTAECLFRWRDKRS